MELRCWPCEIHPRWLRRHATATRPGAPRNLRAPAVDPAAHGHSRSQATAGRSRSLPSSPPAGCVSRRFARVSRVSAPDCSTAIYSGWRRLGWSIHEIPLSRDAAEGRDRADRRRSGAGSRRGVAGSVGTRTRVEPAARRGASRCGGAGAPAAAATRSAPPIPDAAVELVLAEAGHPRRWRLDTRAGVCAPLADATPSESAAKIAGDAPAWTAAIGPASDVSGLRLDGDRALARALLKALIPKTRGRAKAGKARRPTSPN